MPDPDKPAARPARDQFALYFGFATDPEFPAEDADTYRYRRIAGVIFVLIIALLVALIAF